MNIDRERILEALPGSSTRHTPKGWYMFDCVYCGKDKHAGIKFESRGKYKYPSFSCFKCGESGSIFKLLKEINRLDLIDGGLRYTTEDQIENRIAMIEEEEDIEMGTISKPLGYRRVSSHPYLEKRGFTKDQFKKHHVGVTRLYRKLKDYVIFLLYQDGELKGYLARTTWSKEKIDKYNETHEDDHKKYQNAPGVDFSKALYGLDDISENTVTVILVEGITDKFNVDRALDLDSSDEIKCCVTFGKKVSPAQIKRLIDKDIERVVIMYDPDAIDSSKEYSLELLKYFDVLVAFCPKKDPGDMSQMEIIDSISSAETPEIFHVNKVHKKKLK